MSNVEDCGSRNEEDKFEKQLKYKTHKRLRKQKE